MSNKMVVLALALCLLFAVRLPGPAGRHNGGEDPRVVETVFTIQEGEQMELLQACYSQEALTNPEREQAYYDYLWERLPPRTPTPECEELPWGILGVWASQASARGQRRHPSSPQEVQVSPNRGGESCARVTPPSWKCPRKGRQPPWRWRAECSWMKRGKIAFSRPISWKTFERGKTMRKVPRPTAGHFLMHFRSAGLYNLSAVPADTGAPWAASHSRRSSPVVSTSRGTSTGRSFSSRATITRWPR